MSEAESHEFQAEVAKLLKLMVHSVYSEKEVFLRELISNGSDACDKLRYEAITNPELTGGDEDFAIRLTLDEEAKTITVYDNGIGMSRQDLIDNLGTIARSGTGSFIDQLSGDEKEDVSLIGQFGVGFYSSFMIADLVDVTSRRAGSEEVWHWSSDGTGKFTVEQVDDAPEALGVHGTSIVIHVRDDDKEFLGEDRLRGIVKTYSDHIALPISLNVVGKEVDDADVEETLNTASALWLRSKSEITDEQYKEFYHHVGGMFDEPKHRIHYKAEGRHSYSVLLFVPSSRPFDLYDQHRANRVKLYVNRVFITDTAPLLPPYLRFVRGVVDSEDMPLNISREMLQNNPIVQSIRQALTKRVLRELTQMAEKKPEDFTQIWEAFGAVLKEGLYEDFERQSELLELARFKTTKGEALRSLADYVADMNENQTTIYYLAGDDAATIEKSPQLEGFKSRGVEVLLLPDAVDSFWTTSIQGYEGKPFQSVTRGDADLGDGETDGEDKKEDAADTGDTATLIAFLKQVLEEKVEDVRVSKRLTDSAVCLVAADTGLDMQVEKLLARQDPTGALSKRVLEINPDHALIKALAETAKAGKQAQELEDAGFLLFDQARILEGEQVADPSAFAKRMVDMMARALG